MAASIDFYFQTCQTLLERMLNTVPNTVTLIPVPPIAVKPANVNLAVNKNGTLSFTGSVRVSPRPRKHCLPLLIDSCA